MLDQALAQIPDAHRYGRPILIRADTAGGSHGFLAHIRGLRKQDMNTCFSVGVAKSPNRSGLVSPPPRSRRGSRRQNADGDVRHGAQIAEITGMVNRR